jgi:hypothetical protein
MRLSSTKVEYDNQSCSRMRWETTPPKDSLMQN